MTVAISELNQKSRKAFELFLQALVVNKVSSEESFNIVFNRFKEKSKHLGVNFEEMMEEAALWMKQCVPGGNKKWEAGNEPFSSKAGFDLFFKYAPDEIRAILKSGGQPLLNIFSDKLSKDVHASLKTINLEEYENLVKKVDPKEVINAYEECGYTRLGGESDENYITRAISLDYRDAHDDSSLLFDIDALVIAEDCCNKALSTFDNGFELYTYYNDKDLGCIEAQELNLNEMSLKAMAEALLLNNGIDSKIEFVGCQEKIDNCTFDMEFKLLIPPAVGDKFGYICVTVAKPEMYKEIFPVKKDEVAVAVAAAMSLKQKLDFMFKELFPELKPDIKNFRDVVTVYVEDDKGHECDIQAYKDGIAEVKYTDFNIELKNRIMHQIKEILKQKESWASVTASKSETLDKFDMYPNDKVLDVWTRLLEITRDDGSKFWGIDAVDLTRPENKEHKYKDLGHTKTTYKDFNEAKRIFEAAKNRVAKVGKASTNDDKIKEITKPIEHIIKSKCFDNNLLTISVNKEFRDQLKEYIEKNYSSILSTFDSTEGGLFKAVLHIK